MKKLISAIGTWFVCTFSRLFFSRVPVDVALKLATSDVPGCNARIHGAAMKYVLGSSLRDELDPEQIFWIYSMRYWVHDQSRSFSEQLRKAAVKYSGNVDERVADVIRTKGSYFWDNVYNGHEDHLRTFLKDIASIGKVTIANAMQDLAGMLLRKLDRKASNYLELSHVHAEILIHLYPWCNGPDRAAIIRSLVSDERDDITQAHFNAIQKLGIFQNFKLSRDIVAV